MKTGLLLLSSVVLLTTFQAQAKMMEYVSFKGGYSAMKHISKKRYKDSPETPKYKWNGGVASGSVAYGLKEGYLRAEVEANINSIAEKKRNFYEDDGSISETVFSKIKTSSGFFNIYLETPFDFPIKPYVGAGAGMAHVKAQFKARSGATGEKTKLSDNHFAWQVGAGISCEITPEWAIDIGYRFMDFGNIVKKTIYPNGDGTFYADKLRVTAKSHNAYLGIRYMF